MIFDLLVKHCRAYAEERQRSASLPAVAKTGLWLIGDEYHILFRLCSAIIRPFWSGLPQRSRPPLARDKMPWRYEPAYCIPMLYPARHMKFVRSFNVFRWATGEFCNRDFLLIRRPYRPADKTTFIVPPQFEIHLLATGLSSVQ